MKWLKYATNRLLVGAVAGMVLACGAIAVLLLLTPLVDALLRNSDEQARKRISFAAALISVIVATTIGILVRRVGLRFLRTRIEAWRLVTLTDQAIIAVAMAILLGVVLSWQLRIESSVQFDWGPFGSLVPLLVVGLLAGVLVAGPVSDWTPTNPAAPRSRTVYVDQAISGNPEEDLLNRAGTVDFLLTVLDDQRAQRSSIVMAIEAQWGAGKTSLLNLLLHRLREDSRFISIQFDPWAYDSPTAVLAALFRAIDAGVSRRYLVPEFRRLALQYVTALGPTLSKAGFSIDPFRPPEAEVLRQTLSRLTDAVPSHLVVILDDVDRLERPELLTLLKLLKLSADFRNLTYILAADKKYLRRVLQDTETPSFIDKFVDYEIALRVLDQADVDKFVVPALADVASQVSKTAHGSSELETTYKTYIARSTDTLRDAKRLLSSFASSVQMLKGEIYLPDVLIVEFIRRRAAAVWAGILDHPDFFIYIPGDARMLMDTQWEERRIAYYDRLLKPLEATLSDAIREALQYSFPFVALSEARNAQPSPTALRQLRVQHHLHFLRYFVYKLASDDVQEQDLRELLGEWANQATDFEAPLQRLRAKYGGNIANVYDRLTASAREIGVESRAGAAIAVARVTQGVPRANTGVAALRDEQEPARAFVFRAS